MFSGNSKKPASLMTDRSSLAVVLHASVRPSQGTISLFLLRHGTLWQGTLLEAAYPKESFHESATPPFSRLAL